MRSMIYRVLSRQGRRLLESHALGSSYWGPLKDNTFQQYIVAINNTNAEYVTSRILGVLADHAGWLGGYLPDDALLVVGKPTMAKALQRLDGVTWVVCLFTQTHCSL